MSERRDTPDWLGDPAGPERPDPARIARSPSRPSLPRRFYESAGFVETEGGFRLTLDGRPAGTPARRPLVLPTQALAERIAQEWQAQAEVIDPARMPLTRLVNSAIDGVADRQKEVAGDLAAYAGTDLIAYRAGDPERLVAAQAASWDPIVDWAREDLRARLILSEGIRHVTQPEATVSALREAIEAIDDPFRLAALHAMTTLTGSLLIALAVLRGHLTSDQAWAAAHVDETFQADVWGTDLEAQARLESRKAEFDAAAMLAALAS